MKEDCSRARICLLCEHNLCKQTESHAHRLSNSWTSVRPKPLFWFRSDTEIETQSSPKVTSSYHRCIECFSQLSFDSEMYTKSAAVADFVYTSESNKSCEKPSMQR